jgi:YHS domain-containing protein
MTTPANMHWKLVDRDAAAENHEINWRFKVGDQVKIRLVNEMESDHPMHHPFHIHGAGRFLILSRNGVVEANLAWKDTVLVRPGEIVDVLLDVTNPGRWMAHCHIAEHHESGMMFSFNVARVGIVEKALKPLFGDHYEHMVHMFKRTKKTQSDPVCRMSVSEQLPAVTFEYDGQTYFFCSSGCRAKFVANPQAYAQATKS